MKTMFLILAAASLLFFACSKAAQESTRTGNPNFQVDLLFEHEGCRMYRFEDGGRSRYFSNCSGAVSWSETHTCGKNCSRTEDHQIPTQVVKP